MKKLAALFACLLLVSSSVGCGPAGRDLPATVPATGIVTLDGAPVSGAAVTFIADSGNYHATAVTDAAGKFDLKAFDEKPGAVPGSYKVEVNKTMITDAGGTEGEATVNVQFGLPEKYATVATSGLTSTIPEGGTRTIQIELTSAGGAAPATDAPPAGGATN